MSGEAASDGALLSIASLVKSYGGARAQRDGVDRVNAVDDVSLEVRPGELFTLLGPSGCGKTTTLRSVAGLERPDQGRIVLGGRVVFDAAAGVNVPANRRGLGMVFQSYAIWPHMSVFQNTSFPLDVLPRRTRPSRAEIRERVLRVLAVTQLESLADRPATKLSGGQQQRLALARALATQPQLMLLDEPLSNLDAKLRESMRFELKRLQDELGLTTVYVTHDQTEALAMSSRIAVLNDGRVEQIGRPREVYTRPGSRFVAEFIGSSNFIEGSVVASTATGVAVEADGLTLESRPAAGADVATGSRVLLAIRPEALALTTDMAGNGAAPLWRGTVVSQAFLGDTVDYVVALGPVELHARCNPTIVLAPGSDVGVTVDPANVTVVPTV